MAKNNNGKTFTNVNGTQDFMDAVDTTAPAFFTDEETKSENNNKTTKTEENTMNNINMTATNENTKTAESTTEATTIELYFEKAAKNKDKAEKEGNDKRAEQTVSNVYNVWEEITKKAFIWVDQGLRHFFEIIAEKITREEGVREIALKGYVTIKSSDFEECIESFMELNSMLLKSTAGLKFVQIANKVLSRYGLASYEPLQGKVKSKMADNLEKFSENKADQSSGYIYCKERVEKNLAFSEEDYLKTVIRPDGQLENSGEEVIHFVPLMLDNMDQIKSDTALANLSELEKYYLMYLAKKVQEKTEEQQKAAAVQAGKLEDSKPVEAAEVAPESTDDDPDVEVEDVEETIA